MSWVAVAVAGSAVLGSWSAGQDRNNADHNARVRAQAEKDARDKAEAIGSPYRAKLAELEKDPWSFINSAPVQNTVQAGTDAAARSLSIGGNTAESGNGLTKVRDYSVGREQELLNTEKNRLATLGGIANFNQQAATFPTGLPADYGSNREMWNQVQGGLGALAGSYQRQSDRDWYATQKDPYNWGGGTRTGGPGNEYIYKDKPL